MPPKRITPEQKAKHAAQTRAYEIKKQAEDPGFKARKNATSRAWRLANPERVRELNRAWYKTNPTYFAKKAKQRFHALSVPERMLTAARDRARQHGIPFSITLKDIVLPEVCPVLGLPLVSHKGRLKDNSPSLDRNVPRLGYVPGNVMVISYRANALKNNATFAEVEALYRFMRACQ